MTHSLSRLVRLLAATTAAILSALLIAPPAMAGPTVEIRPGALPRGADSQVPHVVNGNVVVDGDRRIRVRNTPSVELIGESAQGYLVGVWDADYTRPRVALLRPDGRLRLLARGDGHLAQASDDGTRLALVKGRRIHLIDTTGRTVLGERSVSRYSQVLDVHGDRVAVETRTGTYVWNQARDRMRRVTAKDGYFADLSADLLAYWTADPYQGGCTRMVRASAPGTQVWRSCEESVRSTNPSGTRMVTSYKLADGLGPNLVHLRGIRGRHLADYDALRAGWFGRIEFENDRRLLLETYGGRWTATVRCAIDRCNRASDLKRT